MADVASIAIRRDTAMARMKAAMERIGASTGVQPVELPAYDRDPAYLEAWRLDVLAGYAEQVADAVAAPPDYSALSNDALLALIAERGLSVPEDGSGASGNVVKSDLTETLESADARAQARAEREAALSAMTVADLDAEAERTGAQWPEAGSGKGGGLVKQDRIDALMAAWDAENVTADGAPDDASEA